MSLIVEDNRIVEMARRKRPPLTPRERCVMVMAAAVFILVPWGWGGVVLWTVAAALGVSLAALVAAVGTLAQQRAALLVWFLWIIAAFISVPAGHEVLSTRWLDYIAFPVAAFTAQAIPAFLYSGDNRSRPAANCLRDLKSSPILWCGLVFIAYAVVQHYNNWGEVIDRAAFWREQGIKVDVATYEIVAKSHISWLPSGLRAPFVTTDPAFPAMNTWRLLMILGAPWVMFLALRSGLRRRRGYVTLAWVSVIASCIFSIFAFLNQPSWGNILGFPVPPNCQTFGTFINRNHAAVYFYFNSALALALTYWHIRRAGDVALRGGPHLLAAFLALFLGLFATFTNSVGGMLVIATLAGAVAPAAFFFGMPRESFAKAEIAFITLGALLVAALIFLFTADFKALERKVNAKVETYQRVRTDDRKPLRDATWNMATAGGLTGRVWTGWGAGSYRWVAPAYQAEQKGLQHPNGKLRYRAPYAHFDWLQALAEVGIIGMIPVLFGVFWLFGWIRRSFTRGIPEAIPVACVLVLFWLHACVDLLFWFTPLLFMASFAAATMIAFVEQSSAEGPKQK